MDSFNRIAMVILASLGLGLMLVVIILVWGADQQTLDRLADMIGFMRERTDTLSKLIATLAALVVALGSLVVLLLELLPEESQPRTVTAAATPGPAAATQVETVQAAVPETPAPTLSSRLERDLVAMPHVIAASVETSRAPNGGIGLGLDLTVAPDGDISLITQEAGRLAQAATGERIGIKLNFNLVSLRGLPPDQTQPAADAEQKPRWGE